VDARGSHRYPVSDQPNNETDDRVNIRNGDDGRAAGPALPRANGPAAPQTGEERGVGPVEPLLTRQWRLVVTEPLSGPMNMAVDEAVMWAHREGLVPPTLRFYTWRPATLTIGYFQSLHREVDVPAVRRAGYDLVRRLTGGRAVLHADEITYSVIIRQELLPGSVLATYRLLSRGLVMGLQALGVPAEVVAARAQGGRGSTAACFDAPARYELTAGGKKLVGSAQTRRRGVLLQHGSIPFTFDLDQVNLLLPGREGVDVARWRAALRRTLARKATSIGEFVQPRPSFTETLQALVQGFANALELELEAVPLTPAEWEHAERLAREKYSTEEWNARR